MLPQVLDVIAPPYTSDFVQLFLPILENDSIAGTIKTEGEHDPVTEFIGKAGVSISGLQFSCRHFPLVSNPGPFCSYSSLQV